MDNELMLDVGQANEFKLGCRKAGWTNADIKRVCEGDMLKQLLPFVRGYAQIVPVEHLINCDVKPHEPSGLVVHEHTPQGMLKWDLTQVTPYLSAEQKRGRRIVGTVLRDELHGKLVLNANVLDYLLAHPELIPESWKGKFVFFWGTIYRDSLDFLCVRYLYWRGTGWDSRCRWLGLDWSDTNPAALLASK